MKRDHQPAPRCISQPALRVVTRARPSRTGAARPLHFKFQLCTSEQRSRANCAKATASRKARNSRQLIPQQSIARGEFPAPIDPLWEHGPWLWLESDIDEWIAGAGSAKSRAAGRKHERAFRWYRKHWCALWPCCGMSWRELRALRVCCGLAAIRRGTLQLHSLNLRWSGRAAPVRRKAGARDYSQSGPGLCRAGLAGGPASQSQARRVLMPQEELQLTRQASTHRARPKRWLKRSKTDCPLVGEMARCKPWHSHGESGLLVLDVDGVDGKASLQTLTAAHGTLPKTLCAKTGRRARTGSGRDVTTTFAHRGGPQSATAPELSARGWTFGQTTGTLWLHHRSIQAGCCMNGWHQSSRLPMCRRGCWRSWQGQGQRQHRNKVKPSQRAGAIMHWQALPGQCGGAA